MSNSRRHLPLARAFGLALTCVACLGLPALSAAPAPPLAAKDGPEAGRPAAPVSRATYDPSLADKTVEFWKKEAARDPQGAIQLRELAAAYLARQRETGDIADAVNAEDAARRSLKILRRGNSAALVRLARALLTQHRFPEALEAATAAATLDPSASRLVADIRMELGDYTDAERALAVDPPKESDGDLNYLALRARVETHRGRGDEALRLLREACAVADGRSDMPAETVAWTHTMIGHTLIDSGKLDEGERACKEALAIFPRDYRAMTGLIEAASARADWAGAVDWSRKALAIAPQNPEALRLAGEAFEAQGRHAEAEQQFRLFKDLAHSFPRIYDRHWVVFCADKGRDLDEALALARKDLALRHDALAYDTLAWACLKSRLVDEADALSKESLAREPGDATIQRHAAEIARAMGDLPRAEAHRAKSKALSPHSVR